MLVPAAMEGLNTSFARNLFEESVRFRVPSTFEYRSRGPLVAEWVARCIGGRTARPRMHTFVDCTTIAVADLQGGVAANAEWVARRIYGRIQGGWYAADSGEIAAHTTEL